MNLQDKQTELSIDEKYIDELLKYDFTSCKKKKDRGQSSILVWDMVSLWKKSNGDQHV